MNDRPTASANEKACLVRSEIAIGELLNGAWTEVQAADLGLTVHFEPGNYSWTAS